MGDLFDRFVVVDWSAAGRPVTRHDSIWVAVLDDRRGARCRLSNPSTRREAERLLHDLLGARRRTLIAVDASLGYPAGTARFFGLGDEVAWRSTWRYLADGLVDDEHNANDRFELAAALNRRGGVDVLGGGPFWGCPASMEIEGLSRRKPHAFLVPEYRLVEQRLRAAGRRPASAWQLLGAGSVGGQMLTLLPVLHRLLTSRSVEVWPFTTGVTRPTVAEVGGDVVIAETWPTAFDIDVSTSPLRDAAQVDGVARQLRAADAVGELAMWFEPEIEPASRAAVETEEGWVLMPPGGLA